MPPTIELDLKEVITQINQKLDTLTKDVAELKTDLKVGRAEAQTERAEIKAEITRLNDKISNIEKRMDFQEFLSKGLLITFVGAVFGILAKLFGLLGNP